MPSYDLCVLFILIQASLVGPLANFEWKIQKKKISKKNRQIRQIAKGKKVLPGFYT